MSRGIPIRSSKPSKISHASVSQISTVYGGLIKLRLIFDQEAEVPVTYSPEPIPPV